jgi:glycosyltransferase involved in cell wall biosynthesis
MEKNKKAVFISCFNAYDNRIKHIMNVLYERGYESILITSNFNHGKKEFYKIYRENTIQINTLDYKKNFSIRRLISHILFSRKAIKQAEKIKPDILYIMLPPNSLAYYASKYKKKYNTRLIFDIYDLWPETFPSKKFKLILSIPFNIWRKLRNDNLKYADVIVTECNLFRDKILSFVGETKTLTLYPLKVSENKNNLNICYLGSINNIIDIDSICELLDKVNKLRRVTVHIIGDGEKRERFIKSLEEKKINVLFYGPIYDNLKKQEIFDKCALGINMMKDTVCVGLTLKSIDYMCAGLPLLNNIQGDTYEIIEKFENGINVKQDLEETAKEIANLDYIKLMQLKRRTLDVYEKYFSIEAFNSKAMNIIEVIIKDNTEGR